MDINLSLCILLMNARV